MQQHLSESVPFPEQPGSCTSYVDPGPGAAWPSRRAPALQGPCRSRSRSSLLQGWGSPQGPVPEEEMAGIGALSELRQEPHLFS